MWKKDFNHNLSSVPKELQTSNVYGKKKINHARKQVYSIYAWADM